MYKVHTYAKLVLELIVGIRYKCNIITINDITFPLNRIAGNDKHAIVM